ncbi:MAG TPA: NAD-glutamate dehydrogenase [Actinomycetota bacterium]|nr:NAD-glutamate dehydrogenase [Actinomycetota bacterium]
MSATDEAAPASRTALDGVVERIASAVPPERVEVLAAFAEAFTRRLAPDDLAQVGSDGLAGLIRCAFELADDRKPRDVAVRVFTPSVAEDGFQALGTVLQTNCVDAPFLFDSVEEELEARGLQIRRAIHPVLGLERSPEGRIHRVVPVREAVTRESVMHFEVERRLPSSEAGDLEDTIRRILGDVLLAVRDFGPMQDALRGMIEIARAGSAVYPADEVEETVAFLQWLLDLNFVFLGYREYDLLDTPDGRALTAVPGSGLGILSKSGWSAYENPVLLSRIEPNLRARIEGGDQLIYSKTNRPSTVHRRARMDYIGVRKVSPDGRIIGESRMIGLFTSKAYMEPASKTPVLARKLKQILEAEDLFEGSHDYKAIVSIFESFPKDELLAASAEEIRSQVTGLLHLQEQQHVRLFVRRDLYGRSVSLLVALPKDRYNAEVGQRLQELFLRRFRGSSIDEHLEFGESGLAQLHFTVHVAVGQIPEVSFDGLEHEVVEIARTWEDRLHEHLAKRHGTEGARVLFERWAHRFPEHYRAITPVELAAGDVLRFEELDASGEPFIVGLSNETHDGVTLTRVRLYKIGGKIQLSDFVPTLESLGLRVVEEIPTQLPGDEERYLHDFGVLGTDHHPLDVEATGTRIADSIVAVWKGECELDSLNRLVVTAGLDWRQVQILRAYRKYHHRVNASFPVEYKNEAFATHPHIAANLVRLFEERFDPASSRDPEVAESVRERLLADLDAVVSLEQDRILRNALGVIDATVRTNAYKPRTTTLSMKFRSAAVPEMPKPTPLYEIFVYSTEVEGIHLRGGKVARGGIRWSDRRQDYRTEVLGLMKAQMVKNAVIVPTGSKGGFVLKRQITEPRALREEVSRQYVAFMHGLLDVTDNLVDGGVVHPDHVLVYDEDDPYLVVAADKGTATFSDIANAVAAEHGFWLGDAFASGGSAGYDHKKLGITARGAWESIKRHFREIGTDVINEPFTVVGIGDMSGDVFGNGMLHSRQICLVAAFDHRHVFVDPNPNPAVGHAERRRLFELPGSSWDDYDRSKISRGGGVWPRSAKSIPISPEARLALGIEQTELEPNELIRAILRAPVDLLYNGGIGTYVKASTESHADVGDRVNDGLRVDGSDLRCRVVAEGGNLGFTQRARVEYALGGGRINTDFIDNSGGVDCSDHEVNLKILLGRAMQRGELTLEQRNRLLQEVEQDVVRHVLHDNFLQAQILSQESDLSAGRMEAFEDLMQSLEAAGLLDRALEALPGGEEMAERRRAGSGMARPELAVLLAYAKQSLSDSLLASSLPDSLHLRNDLRAYFPAKLVERFDHLLSEHPLRRELVATLVANDVVNSMGITFVSRVVSESGAEPADVVRAYRIARDVTGAVERWEAIEALFGTLDPPLLDRLMSGVDRLVETNARWYLQNAPGRLGREIEAHREPFERFTSTLLEAAPDAWRTQREREAWSLMDSGVPEDVARRHVVEPFLAHGPNVVSVAASSERPVEEVTRAFFAVGEVAFIDWLESRLSEVPATTRWHRWALQAVEDDLLTARRRLAERVLAGAEGRSVDEAVEAFVRDHEDPMRRLGRFMRGLVLEEVSDLAAVTVAVRQIRALAG